LATLPENYNNNFYINHMREWPELCLVAEHVPEGWGSGEDVGGGFNGNDDGSSITPLGEYLKRNNGGSIGGSVGGASSSRPTKEIVGYVLGKVETRPVNPPPRQMFPPSKVPLYDEETLLQYMDGNSNGARYSSSSSNEDRLLPFPELEKLGHVTSLAVHSHARRLGIASSLLHQLHFHLNSCYNANSVGLHVRISNSAAVKLYIEHLGYDVADIIPMYYGDGEDAYFMRKDFSDDDIKREENGENEVSDRMRRREQRRLQQQQQRQRPKTFAAPDWVNRDTKNSFFDNKRSMRDTLTPEERAWVNGNNGSIAKSTATANNNRREQSLSGRVQRSFRTFFNNGAEQQQGQGGVMQRRFSNNNFQLPPWETGPEELKLPRYVKIDRSKEERDVGRRTGGYDEGEEDLEEEADVVDIRVASGSV
jgi:ribosomal protein S18 acetylase RimI-like enzyme